MMKKRRRKNWAFPRNEGGEEDWRGGKKETTEKIEEEGRDRKGKVILMCFIVKKNCQKGN